MMSAFFRAGAGIQNILSEWRQAAETIILRLPPRGKLSPKVTDEGNGLQMLLSLS